jgi:hypothetical protein
VLGTPRLLGLTVCMYTVYFNVLSLRSTTFNPDWDCDASGLGGTNKGFRKVSMFCYHHSLGFTLQSPQIPLMLNDVPLPFALLPTPTTCTSYEGGNWAPVMCRDQFHKV